MAGGHPNVSLYCANDPVNGKDPSGTDIVEATAHLKFLKKQIINVAELIGIQPELLAGVVFVECYSGGKTVGHTLNRLASQHKFALGMPASLGVTQFTLDPKKLGLKTWRQRWEFISNFESNYWAQLVLAAQELRELADRPNRYPGRINQLTPAEMSIILTEYNKGRTSSKACDARPNPYGRTFLKFYDDIMAHLKSQAAR